MNRSHLAYDIISCSPITEYSNDPQESVSRHREREAKLLGHMVVTQSADVKIQCNFDSKQWGAGHAVPKMLRHQACRYMYELDPNPLISV